MRESCISLCHYPNQQALGCHLHMAYIVVVRSRLVIALLLFVLLCYTLLQTCNAKSSSVSVTDYFLLMQTFHVHSDNKLDKTYESLQH